MNILSKSFQDLKGKWGLALLITLIFIIINTGLSHFGMIAIVNTIGLNLNLDAQMPLAFEFTAQAMLYVLLFLLAYALISGAMTLGYMKTILQNTTKKTLDANMLISGFPSILKVFAINILTAIFVILWSLLLIIPGIIAAISYSQSLFVLAENPTVSPLDAIRKSKAMMKGYKWKWFGMILILLIFLLLVGAVISYLAKFVITQDMPYHQLIIGNLPSLVIIPVAYTVLSNFYEGVKAESTKKASTKK